MGELIAFLSQFECKLYPTRTTYYYRGYNLFCIQRSNGLVIGVSHYEHFAIAAENYGAKHVGRSKDGSFNGWVRFDDFKKAIKYLEYISYAKISEVVGKEK